MASIPEWLIDWFVPAVLRTDADSFHRARVFVVGHLFGPPLGLVLAWELRGIDPSRGLHWWIIVGAVAGFFAFPFALRLTGRLTLLSFISVQNLAFVILFSAYHYGGASSPVLCWLPTIPLVATFYIGTKPWLRAAVLVCLATYLSIFYALVLAGHRFPEHVPIAKLSGIGIVSVGFAIAFVSVLSLHYAGIVASSRRLKALNLQLEAGVRARTGELERTRREVIERLAAAGEFRDSATGQHVIRIGHYAYHLAIAAGVAEPQAAMIRDAAALHDIGKIGIPDSILLKSDPLQPEEWEVMKRHAAIGGEILADSGFPLLELAHSIALSHHEHWDGSGYPAGLAGEAIPLAGRIVAIVDVFDATTSDRPYKRAWPVERAVAFLKDRAGTQFDPRLVDAFVRELPAILRIKHCFTDQPGTEATRAGEIPRPDLIHST
ncbi:MAG: HD domain-containing protein [Alphaproteobacteria bacterium]|nr:HD domain-containing protein [Alphaproteobacteria bacterium]